MRLFSARSAPPPAPVIAALVKDERQERWRSLTLEANLAFERREDVRARQLFEEALAVAERLMIDAAGGDAHAVAVAPLLHGSTCNSIAELARLQDDRQTAGIYLYRRASCLISIMESSAAPLALRSRCSKHLAIASQYLHEYFEHGGMWDAAATFSERANAALFEVQRLEAAEGHESVPPARRFIP